MASPLRSMPLSGVARVRHEGNYDLSLKRLTFIYSTHSGHHFAQGLTRCVATCVCTSCCTILAGAPARANATPRTIQRQRRRRLASSECVHQRTPSQLSGRGSACYDSPLRECVECAHLHAPCQRQAVVSTLSIVRAILCQNLPCMPRASCDVPVLKLFTDCFCSTPNNQIRPAGMASSCEYQSDQPGLKQSDSLCLDSRHWRQQRTASRLYESIVTFIPHFPRFVRACNISV